MLDATSPIAAEAFAPSLPTIAESMYCMAMVVICVRIAGRLSRQTSRSRGRSAENFVFAWRFLFCKKRRRCCAALLLAGVRFFGAAQ